MKVLVAIMVVLVLGTTHQSVQEQPPPCELPCNSPISTPIASTPVTRETPPARPTSSAPVPKLTNTPDPEVPYYMYLPIIR
jgi:hypothetical protein